MQHEIRTNFPKFNDTKNWRVSDLTMWRVTVNG